MWTTAVNVEQSSNEDIYGNDDDEDKADLVHHTMIHLFKTLLEEYVLCGIRWDELHKN
jgi:hypothetical protein